MPATITSRINLSSRDVGMQILPQTKLIGIFPTNACDATCCAAVLGLVWSGGVFSAEESVSAGDSLEGGDGFAAGLPVGVVVAVGLALGGLAVVLAAGFAA